MVSTITETFKQAKQYYNSNQIEKADEHLDRCIAQLAECTLLGIKEVEGTSVELWKSRCWTNVEKWGLLPD